MPLIKSEGNSFMNTWEMSPTTSVPKLLAAVAQFLPAARTVTFELADACPAALDVYAKHRTQTNFKPSRDTVYPKTGLHYCTIRKALADDLDAILHQHDIKEVFWHVKGFDDRKMLFSIHDADLGDSAYFSALIDEKIVQSIALAIKSQATRLETGYNWDLNHAHKPTSRGNR